jgi:hypothetical protein
MQRIADRVYVVTNGRVELQSSDIQEFSA